jgi:hypothetical protein
VNRAIARLRNEPSLEVKWGLVPDMAGCVLLIELVRSDVARQLTFTGRVVSGSEAVVLGLATRLLDGASPVDAARVLLAEAFEQQRLIGSANQREAVQAGMEDRAPVFR